MSTILTNDLKESNNCQEQQKQQYGYVYLITNNINSKKYIGQHKYSNGLDEKYWGSGKILQLAIDKNGIENFSRKIIQIAYSKDELDKLEKYYIKINNAVFSEEYYNITPGGVGGARYGEFNNWHLEDKNGEKNPFYGHRHTDDTKRRISEAKKGQTPWNKGKKMSKEICEKLKKRKFHLVCKKCGKEFIGTTGSIKYCDECKKNNK